MSKMKMRVLFALAAAAALAGHALAQRSPAPIDQVIAAERAFAADTRVRGFKTGFLASVADNGFIFAPGPINARAQLQSLPDAPQQGPGLFWWPDFAGVASSGDLGFTSGGATIPARYFTVWQRQADGSWRWIYDGGPRLAALLPGDEQGEVTRLAPATAAAGSADAAMAQVAPIETALAGRAAANARTALQPWLASDALIGGSPMATFAGRDLAAEQARRPATMTLRGQGGTASSAGDLVFTYGEARWVQGADPRWGHYARIWQKRSEGWRLVVDLLLPERGAPPA